MLKLRSPRSGRSLASAATLLRLFALTASLLSFGQQPGYALDKTWNNTGTDFNAAGSWTGGVPGSGDAAIFSAARVTNPNLSASLTIDHLEFSTAGASGYNLTSSSGSIRLTLLNTTTGTNAALRSAITSGTNTISAPIVLGAASGQTQTFNQASGGTLVVTGAISSTNTVGLSLRGGGTVQLNGANTYTGNTSIDTNNQTLILGNNNALSTGTFTNNALGATLQAGNGARNLSNSVSLAANLTIGGTDNLTLSGVVSGGSALTKSGASTLALSNTNTYTGSTTINGGTILINNVASLGATTSALTINAGTLEVSSSFSTSRSITLGNAASTIQIDPAQTYTVTSVIGGTGTLNKTGTGALVLGGASTHIYTGGTVVSAGTLQINASERLTNGGTLTISGGTFDLQTFTETTSTVTLTSGSITGSGTGTLVGASYGLQSGTVSAILGGSGVVLTKTTTGSVTLSGANTFTGSTTVSGGTLTVSAGGTGALGSTASVTVNAGGTLLLGANDQIKNTATITLAGGTFSKGAFSEGAPNSAGAGALTLTSAGSHLDFGTGAGGVLSFASFSPGTHTLVIDNWTGTVNLPGGSDRLIFNASQVGNLNNFSFAGYAPGATQFDLGGGFYEITPIAAIPEPSTCAAALLALGIIGYNQKRRLRSRGWKPFVPERLRRFSRDGAQ